MKRRFSVTLTAEIALELDDKVLRAVNDDWRKQFYQLVTPEEIANHIAYNMVVNQLRLTDIDGFANLDAGLAKIAECDWECEVQEMRKKKRATT